MSQFYASIEGQARTEATRRGGKASGITGHVRGWDQGVKVHGFVDSQGREVFEVYMTGGSHNAQAGRLLARLVDGSTEYHAEAAKVGDRIIKHLPEEATA